MIFNKMIKKYNPGIPINLNSLNNYSYKIKIKKINNYNLYYYNEKWQTPVITEKNVFDIYFKNKDLPTNYFAFPWATLIDQYNFNKNTYLIDIVNKYKINDEICFTICQHICFKRIIPILEKIGITHLFTPHKSKLDYKFIKTNIVIIPFILYPVNQNDKLEKFFNYKYLYSFIGNYNSKYYLSDVRKNLLKLKNDNNLIEIKKEWYFHNHVHINQINNNNYNDNLDSEDLNYKNILKNSIFSLCPSGTGVNSIRIYEAMSFGSIPIILSNNIILSEILIKSNSIILFDENNIINIDKFLKNISKKKILSMKNNCLEFYKNYIHGNNFVKFIELYFT